MTQEQANRQKRYRIRQKARAQALLAGGTEIRLAWFGLNPDGYHVAIDEEGNRIDILTRPATAPPVQPEGKPGKAKRLYSPKGMSKDSYEAVVQQIKDKGMTRDQAIAALDKAQDKKAGARMKALVEALPDGPDWTSGFPEWCES